MNDQIKQYIEQQISQKMLSFNNSQQYQAGAPNITPHTHDGNNSSKIKESDLIPSVVVNGTVTMKQGTITGTAPSQVFTFATYTIPTVPNARSVRFYGGALNTTASPAIHAYITGECSLVTGYQYQTATSNSIGLGTIPVNFVQGSAAMIVSNGNLAFLRNSQGHVVYCADSSSPENVYALATVVGYTNSQIIIQTAMQSNWSISGLWVVS